MPDGPYPTPEESALLRMIQESGSPAQAGRDLFARLEALEAWAADLERRAITMERPAPETEAAGVRSEE